LHNVCTFFFVRHADLTSISPKINPDGHCLFAAVADQLAILGILPQAQANYVVTRATAATYIYTHPDDFLPFLPSIDGEDGIGATDAGLITPKQFDIYCAAIRDTGVWGGEPEILALSRAYNIPIHVIQSGTPPVVVHNPTGAPDYDDGFDGSKKVVRISYHRRMYGLGEVGFPTSMSHKSCAHEEMNSIIIHYGRKKA
jgi:OTU domain-containing protein 6